MQFWGVEVKPGQTVSCDAGNECVLHISQVALGETKKGSENVILSVKIDDKKMVLGTLSAEKHPQILYDLNFEKEFELSHNSKTASVFCVVTRHWCLIRLKSDSGEDEDEEEETNNKNPLGNNIFDKIEGKAPVKVAKMDKHDVEGKAPVKVGKMDKHDDDSDEDETDDSYDDLDLSDDDDDDDMSEDESSGNEDDFSDEMDESDEEDEETLKKPESEDESSSEEDDSSDSSEDESSSEEDDSSDESEDESRREEDDSSDESEDESTSEEDDSSDESEDESSGEEPDSSDEEEEKAPKKPDIGKKRVPETLKTPASDKKAKIATPSGQKTGDKKGSHVATPHPAKHASKTPANKKSPKSAGGSHACGSCTKTYGSDAALRSHQKAKHNAAK